MESRSKLSLALAMLLCTSLQAGCADKAGPSGEPTAVAAQSQATANPPISATPQTDSRASSAIASGAYATEQGWGQLSIRSDAGGDATFSLDTENGGAGCSFSGKLVDEQAIVYDGTAASACILDLTEKAGAITIGSRTDVACRTYCGGNGSYAGDYLKLDAACEPAAVQRARDTFKAAYDGKAYAQAETALAPVYRDCLAMLGFVDAGGVRNDYALTQHKLGDDAACLSALKPYDGEIDKSDEEIADGMAPSIVDDYLAIVGAARTNAKLCGRHGRR